MGRKFLILLLAVSASVWADTTVYKRVRPDGTIEFSDSPIPGGAAVQVPDVVTIPAPKSTSPKTSPAPSTTPPKQQPQQISYEAIQITKPADGETVFFDEKGLPVSVAVRPALQPGHSVVVYLDGQLVAKGPQTAFTIKDVFRGGHTLAAAILDNSGTDLVSSAPVTFQMIQHFKRP